MDTAKIQAINACGTCGQPEDAHKGKQDDTDALAVLAVLAALGGACSRFTASDAAVIYAKHLAMAARDPVRRPGRVGKRAPLCGRCGYRGHDAIGCAISGQPPDLPDAGEGGCCMGAAVYGKDRCTCWEPIYDLEQQPLKPGEMGLRAKMCADCAYRPNSPERRGEDGYQGDPGSLDELVMTGEMFACHQGIRRPVAWRHPSGAEVPGHPAGYDPPLRDGKPYKADGTPADICAGWAARRLKHMYREAKT